MKKLPLIFTAFICAGLLNACSEAQYAAHVAKQIPISSDVKNKSVGHYKVGTPYKIAGRQYYPEEHFKFSEVGIASWYGPKFHGKKTANGEIFDKFELTAAHRTLQMPSIVRVTNLKNGRNIILRINDRGPFAHDRVIDLSERSAELLGFKNDGTTKVRIDVLEEASKQVASLALNKQSTRGFEVALNQNKTYLNNTKAEIRSAPIQTAQRAISGSYQANNVENNDVQIARASEAVERQALNTIEPAASNYGQSVSITPPTKPVYEPITTIELPPNKPTFDNTSREIQMAGLTSNSIMNVPSPLAKPNSFFVQAGSFQNEQNALSFSKKLAQYGDSRVYRTMVNNQPTFRVKLGPYDDNMTASRALETIQAKGTNGVIVTK